MPDSIKWYGNFMRKYGSVFFALLFAALVICGIALWQGLTSFMFAWVLNFMLMMAVLSVMETLKPALSSTYYLAKSWEREGQIYRWFGVNLFRKLLVWVGWEKLNKPANPVKKKLQALLHLESRTRQSEFGHSLIFLIVLPVNIFVAIQYGLRQSLWLLFLNVLLNAYPIGVQRYNRPRLQRAISKIKALSLGTEKSIL